MPRAESASSRASDIFIARTRNLTAGSAGGRMKTGIHFAAAKGDPVTRVSLSDAVGAYEKVQQRFKDKRFLLVSVGREHTAEEVKAFAEKNHLTFTFAADPIEPMNVN